MLDADAADYRPTVMTFYSWKQFRGDLLNEKRISGMKALSYFRDFRIPNWKP
jgi:hypothetical protein